MSDHDLRSRLAALHPPAPSGSARDRALHRANLALASARPAASDPASSTSGTRPPFLRPLAILAASALLLVLGLRLAPRPVASSPTFAAASAADSRQLLAQLDQLFPGQLNALVETNGVLRLDLSSAPSPANATPDDQSIVLEFTRAGRHLRVLAYSGRPVRIELDGVTLRFDPLLTTDRAIVLSGDDFVWIPGQPAPRLHAGWQLEARPLSPVL